MHFPIYHPAALDLAVQKWTTPQQIDEEVLLFDRTQLLVSHVPFMASHSNYASSFFRISKTHEISVSAQRSRDLRLKALKASPGSFASTYGIESVFTDAEWVDRITIPDREVFICVATPLHRDGPHLSRLSSRMEMKIFCRRIEARPWMDWSGLVMVSCISHS